MKLRSEIDLPFFEVYPAGLVEQLHLLSHYDKKSKNISGFTDALNKRIELPPMRDLPGNWHEVDALLCWIIGRRHSDNKAVAYGRPDEGQIWI